MPRKRKPLEIEDFSQFTAMTKENKNRFVDCLANSFLGYSQTNWSMAGIDGLASEKQLHYLWQATLSSQKQNSYILADSPEVHGVLIVSKIKDSGTKTFPFLFNGGLKLFSSIPRLLSYESYVKKVQSGYVNPDTWYIFVFGVEKAFQGKNIASRLMKPFLNFLDRTKSECFLETHDQKNVPVYGHYGFSLVDTSPVPDSKLTHFAMLRKPKAL